MQRPQVVRAQALAAPRDTPSTGRHAAAPTAQRACCVARQPSAARLRRQAGIDQLQEEAAAGGVGRGRPVDDARPQDDVPPRPRLGHKRLALGLHPARRGTGQGRDFRCDGVASQASKHAFEPPGCCIGGGITHHHPPTHPPVPPPIRVDRVKLCALLVHGGAAVVHVVSGQVHQHGAAAGRAWEGNRRANRAGGQPHGQQRQRRRR